MLETEAVTVTVEFTTPCVTQIVTVCDPGNVKSRPSVEAPMLQNLVSILIYA